MNATFEKLLFSGKLIILTILTTLIFVHAAISESNIEFDGAYLKTQKGEYIELKEITATTYWKLSLTPGESFAPGEKYFVSSKKGMYNISDNDFKGITIKGQYYFKHFSLHPLVQRRIKLDDKMKTIYAPGNGIEIRSKAIGADSYYFQPRNKLAKGEYVGWIGDKFWLFSIGKRQSSSNIIDRDGVYVAYANGIVKDTKTGLEWKAGPDKDTTWDEAKSWVKSLNIDGGGWRMPTMDELAGLYKKGKGNRNMTPLLKTSGWDVWSGETEGSFDVRVFIFRNGFRGWDRPRYSEIKRAFAVRSRGKKNLSINEIEELLEQKPDDMELWLQLARLSEKKKQVAKSIRAYRRVLDISPKNSEAAEAYLRLRLDGVGGE